MNHSDIPYINIKHGNINYFWHGCRKHTWSPSN